MMSALLVDGWKASEGKQEKIKSAANYIHNGRKTEETLRMWEQRSVIIEMGAWERAGLDGCTLGV